MPLAPNLGRRKHVNATNHVTERGLIGAVGTAATKTRDTHYYGVLASVRHNSSVQDSSVIAHSPFLNFVRTYDNAAEYIHRGRRRGEAKSRTARWLPKAGRRVLLAVSLRFLASFAMSATNSRCQKRAGEQLESERTLSVPVVARAVEITNNNSNTINNFGRDVVNNNWVNINVHPINAATDSAKKQVRAVAS